MSGGSLDYFYGSLEDHVGDFKDKELDDLVKDLAELFHDREWYLSSDTCEGAWNESRDKFKKKWFTSAGRKARIEKYLDDIKDDVMKSLGMSDNYCKNCKHWTKDDDRSSHYGWCDLVSGCMYHRCESCDSFSRRDES